MRIRSPTEKVNTRRMGLVYGTTYGLLAAAFGYFDVMAWQRISNAHGSRGAATFLAVAFALAAVEFSIFSLLMFRKAHLLHKRKSLS